MSTRAQVDWEDENGALARQQEVGTTRSRRALLGGVAGGFALAASGLALPEWLVEETEAADNHPVRRILDRKERQRARRRRDRRQRRDHGDKKGKNKNHDKPRGVAFNPAVRVANDRATRPLQTRGWYRQNPNSKFDWSIPNGWDWATIPAISDPSNHRSFFSDGEDVIVQIGTDRVVWINQLWPFNPVVRILSGGWEQDGWHPKGEELVAPTRMAIGDTISTPEILASRAEDSETHVQLHVSVTDGH